MLDFLSLRLFEGISVPLNFWHHALRLPLVRRVGGRAVSRPVCCVAWTGDWPMVGLGFGCALRGFERLVWSVTFFFFFFFFYLCVGLSFVFPFFLSFAWCPQMLKSIIIKDHLRCRPTPTASFVAAPWEYRYFSRSPVFTGLKCVHSPAEFCLPFGFCFSLGCFLPRICFVS